MTPSETFRQRFSFQQHRLSYALIGLALLAWIIPTFIMQRNISAPSTPPQPMGESAGGGGGGIMLDAAVAPQVGYATGLAAPEPGMMNKAINTVRSWYPQPQNPNINDTREFLKVYYSATIRTRSVATDAQHVETMVRGYSGRIDNSSSGDKYAYLSFVIPKSQLEAFKTELKTIAPARFITENVNQSNLLPQKQNIETQTGSETANLDALKQQLAALNKVHQATVADLNRQLAVVANNLQKLNNENTTDTVRLAQIAASRNYYLGQQRTLQARLTTENNNFTSQSNSLNAQIKYSNDRLDNLATQDQNLLSDVETVQGSVSLEWISLYQITQLYLPQYWITYVFLIAAVLVYVFKSGRRNEIAV